MLKNRMMRLLTSFLITIALVLFTYFVLAAFAQEIELGGKEGLACLTLISCVVGMVFQIICDVLNFKFFCGAVGTWVKNVLFVIISAACFAIHVIICIDLGKYNFYTNVIYIGLSLSTILTCLAFMIATSSDYSPKSVCFLPAISIGVGLILGLIYAGLACIKMSEILLKCIGILLGIAILAIMVVWKIRVDGPFTYFGEADGGYEESSSSLHNNSGRSSDYRMEKGLFSELDSAMRRVASNFCGTYSASYGDSIHIKTSYSSSGHTLSFYVSATISLSESTKNSHGTFAQSQVNDLMRHYNNECSRIQSAAEDALASIRRSYSGYDGGYSLRVHKERPSIER